MTSIKKATVTYAGIPLAATQPIVWKLQTGTAPYVTPVTVHRSEWRNLKDLIGQESDLEIIDARGERVLIRRVALLQQIPSDSPNRVSFLIADQRWRWPYKSIAKEFNVPRKTGERRQTGAGSNNPGEAPTFADVYEYRESTLNNGKRWTPREAVEEVLKELYGGRRSAYQIESFPIEVPDGSGAYSMQNVILNDQADVALSRLLSMIPGAEVYIDIDGKARVIDAADYQASEKLFEKIQDITYDGDKACFVDRQGIRPSSVVVHYQREVECVFEYQDDYGPTTSGGSRNPEEPYLENVLPTVDPETTITVYDPVLEQEVERTVAAGTWVPVDVWLRAMNEDRPVDSQGQTLGLPWTFQTISIGWVSGQLDQMLGGRGLEFDNLDKGSLAARIQALKTHWRQTFRINRAYMDRIRDLLDVRVAVLDPVSGDRAQAVAWNQYCVNPTEKGKRMAHRRDPQRAGLMRNVDAISRHLGGERLIDTPPGAADVRILDKELGIFRVEAIQSPYGTDATIYPFHVVNSQGGDTPRVPSRNTADQDREAMISGGRLEAAANSIYARRTMRLKVMLTIIPAAPNNLKRYHREEVKASDLLRVFRAEFRIQDGKGPKLEVIVPPGEVTARFGWEEDETAKATVARLLGIGSSDPNEAGVEEKELPGFDHVNLATEIGPHARAVAGEMLAPFADNLQGRVSARLDRKTFKIEGNLAGASVVVSAAPSAKVSVIHEFPGQAKPVSRMALLPDAARRLILGIIPFRGGSS